MTRAVTAAPQTCFAYPLLISRFDVRHTLKSRALYDRIYVYCQTNGVAILASLTRVIPDPITTVAAISPGAQKWVAAHG
jgi:hypothetical protein